MRLNIKNEEADRLARELASLTGESITASVTQAVRERLERVKRKIDSGKSQGSKEVRRPAQE